MSEKNILSNLEIQKKVYANNEKIKELMVQQFFTLNYKIELLTQENKMLALQCQHEYDENGFCKFCLTKSKGE